MVFVRISANVDSSVPHKTLYFKACHGSLSEKTDKNFYYSKSVNNSS